MLEWIFNVFNGLEGLWAILLYIIIYSQRIDEQKRVKAAVELSKTTSITNDKYRSSSKRDNRKMERELPRDTEVTQRSARRDPSPLFTDLQEAKNIDWPVNDESSTSL